MKKSFFMTGTDTGVGKTYVTAGLARAAHDAGETVGVMKPVETGCDADGGGLVAKDAVALKDAALCAFGIDTVNPYRFRLPLSPHLASRLEGVEIDMGVIKKNFDEIAAESEIVLVEGAGGLLVPLNGSTDMAGLALYLGLPLLIVADSRLGVLNHASLTVECARARGLDVEGIILNNTTPAIDEPGRAYNRAELERITGLPVFAEVPFSGAGQKKDAPFREGGVFERLIETLF